MLRHTGAGSRVRTRVLGRRSEVSYCGFDALVGLNGDWRWGSDLWDTDLQGLCKGADLLCVADVLSDGWA